METKTQTKEVETNTIQVTNSKNFPFVLVDRNGKITICAANSQVSDKTFDSIDEAEAYIESRPYDLIINTCCYCMQLQAKSNEK